MSQQTRQPPDPMVDAPGYVRPTDFQVATSFVHGLLSATPLPTSSSSPREALADAIRPSLEQGPCHVTFSGGRDSSAVLAVAVDVARREGLPLPIPVTRFYPGVSETDESDWQRTVIDHLDLTNWIRLEIHEEHDLLGPAAQTSIAQRGMLWPPALHIAGHTYEQLDDGWILTGEGGDQVLGNRRVTKIATLIRNQQRPSRTQLAGAVRSIQPRSVRRRRLQHGDLTTQPWLLPDVLAEHHRLIADDELRQPLRYDQATWWIHRRRAWDVIDRNHAVLAADFGMRTCNPLLDPGFLAALANEGGAMGFPGRTATMQALFTDLLPPALLSRTTKASFNGAYAASASRDFAASWDGSGVNTEMVDAERLQQEWLSDNPSPTTSLLLQGAWLASQSQNAWGLA